MSLSLLQLSLLLFAVAVALGLVLAVLFMRGEGTSALSLPAGLLHGAIGTTGLAVLLVGLQQGPVLGLRTGSSGFGPAAAVCFIVALAGGVMLLAMRFFRRRPPGLVVAVHAGVAVTAFVLLLGYVSLG